MNAVQHNPSKSAALRVCIIDDDQDVIAAVEKLCSANGHEVLGITRIIGSSSKVNQFKPHVILLDIKMPILSGQKLMEVFQNTLTEMPRIILLSAMEPEKLRQICEDSGADDFHIKGDGFRKLISKINGYAQALKLAGSHVV